MRARKLRALTLRPRARHTTSSTSCSSPVNWRRAEERGLAFSRPSTACRRPNATLLSPQVLSVCAQMDEMMDESKEEGTSNTNQEDRQGSARPPRGTSRRFADVRGRESRAVLRLPSLRRAQLVAPPKDSPPAGSRAAGAGRRSLCSSDPRV